jgi:dienelactone hydrolase
MDFRSRCRRPRARHTVVACDGGLLLSTARMGEVQVDPEGRTATVGPGALWSDVLAAAAPYQLAPLSGRASSVGVAGYTLGGGTGWLSRKHGFAADSVLGAAVVTAGGETVTASATDHPDLFWALRGGGGNFGVVTRLRFKLYPVAWVYAGMSWHPADRGAAVVARYDWAGTEPDELTSAVLVQQVPPRPRCPSRCGEHACYLGPAGTAERLLRPPTRDHRWRSPSCGTGAGPWPGRRPTPARSAIPTCRSRSPRWPPTTGALSRSGSTRPWTGWSRGCDRVPAAARS